MKEEKDDDFGAASPQKGGAGDEADLQPAIQPRQNENPQNVALPPTSHLPPPTSHPLLETISTGLGRARKKC